MPKSGVEAFAIMAPGIIEAKAKGVPYVMPDGFKEIIIADAMSSKRFKCCHGMESCSTGGR